MSPLSANRDRERGTDNAEGSVQRERKREKEGKREGGRARERKGGRELKIDFSQRGSVCSLTLLRSVIPQRKEKSKEEKIRTAGQKLSKTKEKRYIYETSRINTVLLLMLTECFPLIPEATRKHPNKPKHRLTAVQSSNTVCGLRLPRLK